MVCLNVKWECVGSSCRPNNLTFYILAFLRLHSCLFWLISHWPRSPPSLCQMGCFHLHLSQVPLLTVYAGWIYLQIILVDRRNNICHYKGQKQDRNQNVFLFPTTRSTFSWDSLDLSDTLNPSVHQLCWSLLIKVLSQKIFNFCLRSCSVMKTQAFIRRSPLYFLYVCVCLCSNIFYSKRKVVSA